MTYLADNLDFVEDYLRRHLPPIKMIRPEGTFLVWLDFGALGLAQEALVDLVTNQAKLWLNSGTDFGPQGAGFMRLNVGCPRSILAQAMQQLREALLQKII